MLRQSNLPQLIVRVFRNTGDAALEYKSLNLAEITELSGQGRNWVHTRTGTCFLVHPPDVERAIAYAKRHFSPFRNGWINPGAVRCVRPARFRETAVLLSLPTERLYRHGDISIPDLTRKAGLTEVGRETFVSLADTLWIEPGACRGILHRTFYKINPEYRDRLIDFLHLADWIAYHGYFGNPHQAQALGEGKLIFSDERAFPLSALSASDRAQVMTMPWFAIGRGQRINLINVHIIKKMAEGKSLPGRDFELFMGNGLSYAVSEDIAFYALDRAVALRTSDVAD